MWFICFLFFFVCGVSSLQAQDSVDQYYEYEDELRNLEVYANRMKASGDIHESIVVLEKIVQLGGHDRYKLDLAVVYFRVGRYSDSYSLFVEVLETPGVPTVVCQRVQVWMNRLEPVMDRYYGPSFLLSTSIGYDTNINLGPKETKIRILGYWFDLDEAYRAKAGAVFNTNLLYKNRLEFPPFMDGGVVTASFYYKKVPDFELIDVFRFKVGYTAEKYSGKSRLSIPFSVSYGGEGPDFEFTTVDLSAGLKYSYPINPNTILLPSISYTYRYDPRNEEDYVSLEGSIISGGTSISFRNPDWGNNLSIVPFIYVSYSDAHRDPFYHYLGGYIGTVFSYSIQKDLLALLNLRYDIRKYKERDPRDIEIREDSCYTATVTVKKRIVQETTVLTPNISYRYRYNDSNIVRRTNDSHYIAVGLDVAF